MELLTCQGGFPPPSPPQLPPLTSLPAPLTPLPATPEPQHWVIYQIEKKNKSLAPNLFSGAGNTPQCIPSCAASPAPHVALWRLSCLGPCSNKAERSETVQGRIFGLFFPPKAISNVPCGRRMQETFSKYTHPYLSQERYHRLQTETGGTIAETKRD